VLEAHDGSARVRVQLEEEEATHLHVGEVDLEVEHGLVLVCCEG
jgi:hypothetical protein